MPDRALLCNGGGAHHRELYVVAAELKLKRYSHFPLRADLVAISGGASMSIQPSLAGQAFRTSASGDRVNIHQPRVELDLLSFGHAHATVFQRWYALYKCAQIHHPRGSCRSWNSLDRHVTPSAAVDSDPFSSDPLFATSVGH